jgi:hypothetical protein
MKEERYDRREIYIAHLFTNFHGFNIQEPPLLQGEHKVFPYYKYFLQEKYVAYKQIVLYNAIYDNTKLLDLSYI